MHGGPKYNIDFTGGTLVHLKFVNDVEIQNLRSALASEGQAEAEIKHFGAMNEISIRTMDEGNTEEEISITIENLIEKALPDNPFVVQRVEKVGPKIGRELIFQALKAVFWAMLLILIYIMWRFEFKFSIGAIAALLHDIARAIESNDTSGMTDHAILGSDMARGVLEELNYPEELIREIQHCICKNLTFIDF